MCGTSLLNNVFIGQPCGMTENILCLLFINICTEEKGWMNGPICQWACELGRSPAGTKVRRPPSQGCVWRARFQNRVITVHLGLHSTGLMVITFGQWERILLFFVPIIHLLCSCLLLKMIRLVQSLLPSIKQLLKSISNLQDSRKIK